MVESKFNQECKQLWKDTVIAFTQAANSTKSHKAAEWADQIIDDFKERYEETEETEED